ncbi:leucine-rich repeat receptor serine/threonine-protein kinase [Spatholobus suberectus]|nr:leucine-rich repeat receptor serine/threonine-protein kinase [Spatholobus suberectus]
MLLGNTTIVVDGGEVINGRKVDALSKELGRQLEQELYGACGVILPLVSLLLGGSNRGKKDMLMTLYKLCSVRQNKERVVSARGKEGVGKGRKEEEEWAKKGSGGGGDNVGSGNDSNGGNSDDGGGSGDDSSGGCDGDGNNNGGDDGGNGDYKVLALWFTSLAGATTQPDEVKALREIAKTLGKKDWDFNIDPCSGHTNWTSPPVNGLENNVTCNCFIADDNYCHVVNIYLTGQNLQGSLPPELIRLPYIQQINFSLNYLGGTIPKEWGSLKLLNITLFGNRLSGSIPLELANITALRCLILESNHFSGNLPPQLGHLPYMEILHLSSNNFTGELPETFSNLTTLNDVRLGDNQFSGKIPNFIERWTSLQILDIQGSGLAGPFPSGLSFPQSLTKLEVSDLSGPDSTFPSVNITGLERLILRSCNINDTIPDYIGKLPNLKVLDLSYNKLSGKIPSTFEGLKHVMYIYLSGNFLTGSVPWTQKLSSTNTIIDLSYNNFSNDNGGAPDQCQESNT